MRRIAGVLGRSGMVSRIVALSIFGVILLGVSVTGLTRYLLHASAIESARERVDANMRVAWDALRAKGTPFSIADGKLLAGEHVLNGDFAVVDAIKALVGGTATVFMGDMRVSTNVMKPDGTRAIGTQLARTAAYQSVFERKAPFRGEVEILGQPYMTAYDPIVGGDGNVIGVLYVGIRKADFLKAAEDTLWTVVGATVLVGLLTIVIALVIARRSLVAPLQSGISTMRVMAEGTLDVTVAHTGRKDELGEMSRALEVFRQKLVAARELAELQKVQQDSRESAAKAQGQMVEEFNSQIVEVISTVIESVGNLETNARSMTSISDEIGQRTNAVAAASEQAAANVQTVAAASEELAASSREIASQVGRATLIAQNAAAEAATTDQLVRGLAESASRIGDVVKLINDIASQTNLLALNATVSRSIKQAQFSPWYEPISVAA